MARPLGLTLLSLCLVTGGCVTSFDLPAHIDKFALLARSAQDYYRANDRWPRNARELMAWTVAQSNHPDTDFTQFQDLTVRPAPTGALVMRWRGPAFTMIEFTLSRPAATTAPAASGSK